MKTDEALRQTILDELEWNPSVTATEIGVAVRNGIVELTGHVSSYAEKRAAEQCVQKIAGVKGLALEINVRLPNHIQSADDEIAERAARILGWNAMVPPDVVKVTVEKGWVTMRGEVDWNYQRDLARADIEKLSGVIGLANLLTVKERVLPVNVKNKIEDAFRRDAVLDAAKIKVQTRGSEVVLEGRIHDWHERELATQAAWSAPGVSRVTDHLQIA